MIPFFILLVVPIIMQHIRTRSGDYQKKNKLSITLFFVLLTILIMFRHSSVGTDTDNYIMFFRRFAITGWENLERYSIEIGFSYFNKIISLISFEPHFFLAITAVLICCMILPTYRRLCVDASLTIVLYCVMSTFVMMFSGIRQMLAIGMGFIAYEFTHRKKVILFILVVLSATTFHTSAFMLVFMYPLYHAKITKKWLYVVIPVLAVIILFNKPIFSALALVLERYTSYDASITQTGAYTMLVLFVVFSVFAFFIPEESCLDDETIGLRNFLLFALALQMFAPLHNLAMRMNYYYIIFIPLLLPKIISCRSKRWEQVAIFARHAMVVFFLVYFFFNAYTASDNLKVFPYHFFWETI